MPPGFNEACYGGDFDTNLAGAKPIYSAELTLDRPSRPVLLAMLAQLANEHRLKVFDEGAKYKEADLFLVYLCSSKGAFAFVDSRAAGPNAVRIVVFSYRNSWSSKSFATDLDSKLSSEWPKNLKKLDPSSTTLGNSIL